MKPNDLHQPSLLGQMIAKANEEHLNSPAMARHFISLPRYLRHPRFIDLTGRRDRQKCYVDPIGDFRDAFLMTEWTRAVRHAKGFGRDYKRMQFCRAFAGCSSADILEVEAV